VQPTIRAGAEVLIMDNNCPDQTAQLVDEFRERLAIRRIVDGQQGLSCARKRAAAEFRWDLCLLMCSSSGVRLAFAVPERSPQVHRR
jgi:glycosyltransferase involved in cell wall biosynthesis